MSFVDVSTVRLLAGLSTSVVNDTDLETIISYATAQLNSDILTHYEKEQVLYIDTERENNIDGSNTTFYVKHPYIGDFDNDGTLDGSDLYVWSIDTEGNRVEYTVSSIDQKTGQFVLSSAPTGDVALYVEYSSSPVDESDNKLVEVALSQLSAAYAYMRQNTGGMKSWHVGKISVVRDPAFDTFLNKYKDTVNKILERWLLEGKSEDYV